MMILEKGEIVLVKFPFTDLQNYKLRPALVISNSNFNNLDNIMLIGIFGNKGIEKYSYKLENSFFENGKMNKQSYLRLQNIFTLHKSLNL
ncbi:MAG: type II toxin-antitoxin system PemK/MazF family toxin [Candidatus Gracilibacteria bacterium]|nr:type II toxin-antitoxin system PemK/MazF family toxin [Candidatus Gracilibacteria bacterium]